MASINAVVGEGMDQVTGPRERAQTEQTSQVVVEHRLNVLEPLNLELPCGSGRRQR